LAYRFEWVSHGTELRKFWEIQYLSDEGDLDGPEIWVDLGELKFSILRNDNSAAVRSRKEAEQKEADRLVVVAEEQEKERENVAAGHKWLQKQLENDDQAIDQRWRKQIEAAMQSATAKALSETKLPKVKAYLTAKAHEVREECKHGSGKYLTMRQASAKAQDDFVHKKEALAREAAEEAVAAQRDGYAERRAAKLEAGVVVIETQTQQREIVRKRKKQLVDAELHAQQAIVKRRLRIPADKFRLAVPQGGGCCDACEGGSVVSWKSWGSKYANGAACSKCGLEVMFKGGQQSQNAKRALILDALIDSHRKNEAGFRTSPAQLKVVEAERLRLEKERREVELANVGFIDDDSVKPIAEMDYRHGQRQGNLELVGCPTFRANDIKAHNQYKELLRHFARVNASRNRQSQCADSLVQFREQRFELTSLLKALHRSIPKEEAQMQLVEDEHLRAHQLLILQDEAVKVVVELKSEMELGIVVLEEACVDLAGRVELADNSDQGHGSLVKVLHSALRHRKAAAMTYMQWVKKHKSLAKKLVRETEATEKATQELVRLQYRRQGHPIKTPYGWANVLMYREVDDMIIASIKFNKRFKLFIPLEKVVHLDQKSQQSEVFNMRINESEAREVWAEEAAMLSKELKLMAVEDALMHVKRREEADELRDAEELEKAVAVADADAREMMEYPIFKSLMRKEAAQVVQEVAVSRALQAKNLEQGKGFADIPKKLTMIERMQMTEDVTKKNTTMYHKLQVDGARAHTLQAQKDRREQKQQNDLLSTIIDDMAQESLLELCQEALDDSYREQRRAEEESRIVLDQLLPPDLTHMHFGAYHRINHHWTARKEELRKDIQLWKGMGERAIRRMQEEDIRKAEESKKRAELKLIRTRCEEMGRAEKETRNFMRAELKVELGNRRAMQAEEKMMKKYMKAQALIEKDAEQANSGSGVVIAPRAVPTANENARMNVKQRKFEKRRLAREWVEMEFEDKLAKAVRIQSKQEEVANAASAQNAVLGDDDSEGSDGAESSDEDESSESEEDAAFDSDELGDEVIGDAGDDSDEEFKPPPPPPKFETAKQKGRRERKEKKAAQRARIKLAKKNKRDALLRAIDMQLDDLVVVAVIKCFRLELNRMQLEEDKWQAFRERERAKTNAEKYALYSQKKGQQEIRSRLEARHLREVADKAIATKDSARRAVDLLRPRVEHAQEVRRTVFRDTTYMDSFVMHGTHGQRMLTKELYRILHREYFVVMVRTLALKAEICCLERRLFRCCSEIQRVETEKVGKCDEEKTLWRDYRRGELLKLLRSELGKQIFGKSQLGALRLAFTGWTKFWLWRMSIKAKFTMAYGLKKQGIDLRRVDEEIASREEREMRGVDLGRRGDGTDMSEHVKPTTHAKHNQRLFQCQLSGKSYSDNMLVSSSDNIAGMSRLQVYE
jgi:hypothetical protein